MVWGAGLILIHCKECGEARLSTRITMNVNPIPQGEYRLRSVGVATVFKPACMAYTNNLLVWLQPFQEINNHNTHLMCRETQKHTNHDVTAE